MEPVVDLSFVRVALVREAAKPCPAQNAADVASLARAVIGDADREMFLVLCLDTKLRVNAAHVAAVRTIDSCPVTPRAVFTAALLAGAASVVLAHNHPSGEPSPSPDDRDITRRLCQAGEILGIPVQDHVIVGQGRVYSFRGEGEMPSGGGRRARRLSLDGE